MAKRDTPAVVTEARADEARTAAFAAFVAMLLAGREVYLTTHHPVRWYRAGVVWDDMGEGFFASETGLYSCTHSRMGAGTKANPYRSGPPIWRYWGPLDRLDEWLIENAPRGKVAALDDADGVCRLAWKRDPGRTQR